MVDQLTVFVQFSQNWSKTSFWQSQPKPKMCFTAKIPTTTEPKKFF